MKLTKFLAASIVAVTLFSCSEEIVETSGLTLNPGEARVEIDLGKGVTTYASQGDETLIMDNMYALYLETGAKISVTDAGSTAGKIAFTVAAADVAAGSAVKLVVVANTAGFKTIADAAIVMPATFAEAEAMTVKGDLTNDTGGLPKGLPSSQTYSFTLQAGNIAVTPAKLSRAASRIYVKNNGTTDYASIAGYSIKYTGAIGTNLVSRLGTGIAGLSNEMNYTVLATTPTGNHTSGQSIGYVYPSTSATFTVSFGGATKTVSFPTLANKNYGLNIIPSTTPSIDGSVSFDISISDWENSTETDVDMNGESNPVINAAPASKRISIANNIIKIEGGSARQSIDLAGVFTGYTLTNATVVDATRAVDALVVALNGTKLMMAAPENFTQADLSYSVVLTATKDEVEKTFTYQSVVTPSPYPANFIQRINDLEVMMINAPKSTSNTAADNLAAALTIVNDINVTAGSTLLDKIENYFLPSLANFRNLNGSTHGLNAGYTRSTKPVCPTGFRQLTIADVESILGYAAGTFVTTYAQMDAREKTLMDAGVTGILDLGVQYSMKNNRKLKRLTSTTAPWNNDEAITGAYFGSPSRYAEITSDGNDPFYYFQASSLVFENANADTRVLILKETGLTTMYTGGNATTGSSAYRCVRN